MYKKIFKDKTGCYKDKKRTILYREDGPAYETVEGYKEWWLNNKQYFTIHSNEYWIKFVKTLILE